MNRESLNKESLIKLVPALANRRVLLVGDVILDEYLIGHANRLSREAPIPVLEFDRRECIPGGAANPSMNMAKLGSKVIQVGVVGKDSEADMLSDILRQHGIDPSGLVADPTRTTTTKTRVMAHMGLRFPQQLARIDRIHRHPVTEDVEKAVIAAIDTYADQVDVLVVSDYLSGLLTVPIVQKVRDISVKQGKLSTADAQGELDKYAGFDLVKCNADEAMRYLKTDLDSDADFAQAGASIVKQLGLGAMLITRGSDGVTVAQRDGKIAHVPAVRVEDVYDTVGAGDTALAVVTLALAAGATNEDAAALANLAAGIVVRKVGNYTPSPDELLNAVMQH